MSTSANPNPASSGTQNSPSEMGFEPIPARLAADPLAEALRVALASLVLGSANQRTIENGPIVPSVGLNVPGLGQ